MIAAWHRLRLLALVTVTALLVMTSAAANASLLPRSDVTNGPGPMLAAAASTSTPRVVPVADRVLVVPSLVTPTVVNRSTPVTVSGSVTARVGTPLSGARIRAVAAPTNLTQRPDVAAWAGTRTPARGSVVAETALPAVAAGQTTSFTLTIPAGRIRSSEAFAALPISLEVVPSPGAAPSGVTHTFLAWQGRKEYLPIRVAMLVPLTLAPDIDLFSRDETVRMSAWAEHLGQGSRVARILEGTRGSVVTLAVDPSLFGPESVSSATDAAPAPSTTSSPPPSSAAPGPSTTRGRTPTATPSGSATSGPAAPTPSPTTTREGEAGIGPLVDGLVSQLRGRDVWALPYADADIAATVDISPTNPLVRDLIDRAGLVGTRLGTPARADAFWPIDGSLSAVRDRGLKSLVSGTTVKRVGAVVVRQAAVTEESAYTPSAVRSAPSGTRLLAFDDDLSALLPEAEISAALATQQFLAESLVLLGERPGTARSVLLAAPRDYDPASRALATFLKAVSAADWLEPVPADALIRSPGPATPLVQQTPRRAPAAIAPVPVLTANRLADLAEQRETLLQVATVLRDGAAFKATYREVLDELAGVRWREAPEAWQLLSDSVVADTKAATSAIKIVPQGVNFLAAQGTLRITVRNGLDYTIEGIRLVVEPNNPRMTVEQPGPITIGPGAMTTVRVPATALAAGRVDIRAYLTTADGTPIGQPAIMKVSANPLDSTFYWAGAILVGLVLLAGLIRTIRKGTSRVEEIGDLETVVAQVEGIEEGDRG